MKDQDPVILFPMTRVELNEVIKEAVREGIRESRNRDKKELLNSSQLCEWLQISNSTLNVWKRENKIPYKRLGKRIFFSKIEVMGALKESNYNRLKELGA